MRRDSEEEVVRDLAGPRAPGAPLPSTGRRDPEARAARPFDAEPAALPEPVRDDLTRALGSRLGRQLAGRLTKASEAYGRDRYGEARRILEQLARRAPDVAAVRELYGLTLYREGRWREALRELGAYAALTGSVDQHPVLADCYRALRRPEMVTELWDELRRASPGADLLTEGLLVLAGAHADAGDLPGAIALLEQRFRPVRHPTPHHVRLWYALADLYERSGDIPAARRLFGDVARADPELGAVTERLAALT